MKGTFIKKPFWSIWCLICGLFLIALFVFLKFADSESSNNVYAGIIFGAVISICSLISLTFNLKAFIRIEGNHIFAKYHWFGKLDCSIGDVAFALAQANTLTILLKNSKRHVIMGIENPWPLSSAIRSRIFFIEKAPTDALWQQLEALTAKRKQELFWVLGGVALMFVNLFIAVVLTGGKEMHAFCKLDWILFAIMSGIELLTLIGTFYAAQRCGKDLLPIEQLKYRLKGALIATQPLPSNNFKCVYTDENYTGRIVVCGFPNDPGVYYHVQEFTDHFTLETVHTSEIYESQEALPTEALESLIDISAQFIWHL